MFDYTFLFPVPLVCDNSVYPTWPKSNGATQISRNSVKQEIAENKQVKAFTLKTMAELNATTEASTDFVVDGLLPAGGLSALCGKPKCGKSTLARQLAVCVAEGRPFLDRDTEQGAVLYFALEEKESEIKMNLQRLGATSTTRIKVLTGAVPKKHAAEALRQTMQVEQGVRLIILDPIFRFLPVKDNNDYVTVNNALEEIMEIARHTGAHILAVHHMKKKETDDLFDGVLGTTAIAGGSDTMLALSSDNKGQRTICSRQRYGAELPRTLLQWNADNRELSLGQTCEDVLLFEADKTQERIRKDFIDHVAASPNCEQTALVNCIQGKTTTRKDVLQQLVNQGIILRAGAGYKGDPHTLSLAPGVRDIPSGASEGVN
jgi:hypothetical protein